MSDDTLRLGSGRALLTTAWVVVVLLTCPGRGWAEPAPTPESAKRELEARYAALKPAMAERDRSAMAVLMTPDVVSEDVSGKTTTFDQLVLELAKVPKDPNRNSDTTILSVKLTEDVATVRQRYHMTTTKLAPDGVTKQAIEMDALSTDTWVRIKGAWLLKRTVTEEMNYKVDGRLVAHRDRSTGR
jgi:hypothetical protein